MQGCVTSGEQWTFFVYKSDDASGASPTGGEISISEEIRLGVGLGPSGLETPHLFLVF